MRLGDITAALQRTDKRLTPGMVAAHALRRPLAPRAAARAARTDVEQELKARLRPISGDADQVEAAWAALRRAGWVTRLVGDPDAERMLDHAAGCVNRLRGRTGGVPLDRRVLAHEVTGNPHALDDDQPLAAMVIAVLAALGVVDQGGRGRGTWARLGVHFDSITAGLSMVGIAPAGWTVPAGSPVTLPPYVLADCEWDQPGAGDARVFVTENPSVLTALLAVPGVRAVCTSGKPSGLVVETLAALDRAGWELWVRADFDDTGVASVNTILAACGAAQPWRMGADDYLDSVGASGVALRVSMLRPATWDPDLVPVMRENGHAAFEEASIPALIDDARAPHWPAAQPDH